MGNTRKKKIRDADELERESLRRELVRLRVWECPLQARSPRSLKTRRLLAAYFREFRNWRHGSRIAFFDGCRRFRRNMVESEALVLAAIQELPGRKVADSETFPGYAARATAGK